MLGNRVRELDRQESLRLLSKASVGRIVHTRDALPAVLLVNFGLDADSAVLVRTAADSEVARALDGAVVAFEADEIDGAARSGWSVVVIGRSTVVNGPMDVVVRVDAELVTGREFTGGPSRARARNG
ncbi:pyridoxamine 5'-phosphate oxidase family protein [Streptomyces sp. NPDC059037]|uniref:pyridoxamine 5'-phosphate oxidase family protein n=1 Tax=Streptomyces sp. NPDC059037 TaxID=3346710 RepID=UPI0036A78036